jgi:hypothetical protein
MTLNVVYTEIFQKVNAPLPQQHQQSAGAFADLKRNKKHVGPFQRLLSVPFSSFTTFPFNALLQQPPALGAGFTH